MKKLLLALALFCIPSMAMAQCNGVFPNNTVCGNATGASNTPRVTSPAAFLGAAGGTNGQVQVNVAGALGGLTPTQLTAIVNNVTASLPGLIPAFPNDATKFFNGVGAYAVPAYPIVYAVTRTALKAIDTTVTTQVILTEAGRSGLFVFTSGNFTTAIATDTNEGVYIKATAIAASSGAWVRQFDFTNFQAKWFGAIGDYSTDNTAIVNSMIAVSNIQNTSSSSGQQTSVFLNIEGGVKFASQNLSWLPAVNWVFVYIRYWANSDTTQGVSTGGGGTNERYTISVNSGFPGDSNGALVAEEIFNAPLHPAQGVNIQKNVDNSIFVHSGTGQSIQPNDSLNSASATVAYIRDENLDRFYLQYNRFAATSAFNGVFFNLTDRTTALQCTGCDSATWGGHVPAPSAVVRGVTSLSRYVVIGSTTNQLNTEWISGTALPGEFLMNERAIFQGSISGTTLTVSLMLQGSGNIAVGQTVVGMYANNGITASTTITGLGTGTGGLGTYTINNSQTIAKTEIVAGYVAANGIFGGGVVNTDTTSTPVQIGIDGQWYTRNATFLNRSKLTYTNNAAAAAGTLTNAPSAGNPTKWIAIDDNGTTRFIPAW